MPITAHPDALTDASAINAAGGLDYLVGIGELSTILDHIFDGTRTIEDLFYEHPQSGTVRRFTRQFWGDGGASVVAAVFVSGSRSVWTSLVAVDLPVPTAGYPIALSHAKAEDMALDLAQQRF